MAQLSNSSPAPAKVKATFPKTIVSYRGFASIDQEMEREIAMQWFTLSGKTTCSQRNFLLKKETGAAIS